jgi:hypothetical protein
VLRRNGGLEGVLPLLAGGTHARVSPTLASVLLVADLLWLWLLLCELFDWEAPCRLDQRRQPAIGDRPGWARRLTRSPRR